MILKLCKFIILVLPLWCGILVKGLQDLDFTENDVKLIVPQVAEVYSDVSMYCKFDAKATSIYSVKWYKGQSNEFFRFSPKERPEKKFFEIPGLEGLVNVDMNHSDINKIILKRIPLRLTGNISCEVTPESTFKPVQKYQFITVIAPPESNPILETMPPLPRTFQANDVPLKLKCKVGPTKPVANVTFYINNNPYESHTYKVRSVQFANNGSDKYRGFEAREAELTLTLQSEHYNDGKAEFKCAASIYNITRYSDVRTAQQYVSSAHFGYSGPHTSSVATVISSLANFLLLFGLQLFLSKRLLLL